MITGSRIMQINDTVYVKTDADEPREGRILLIEPFSEGVMYLVALPEYPDGIWFFNEKEGGDGVFITTKNNF
ncbi:protein DsrB [Morganella morganii]|nr:protein DsrB [Morganella morganii]